MTSPFGGFNIADQRIPPQGLAEARAANAHMSVEQYHRFLQGMGGQPGVAQSSIASPAGQVGGMVNPQSVMGPGPVARTAQPTAYPTQFGVSGTQYVPGMPITSPMYNPMMQQGGQFAMGQGFSEASAANAVQAPADNLAISDEAFNAAFADFDDGEFQEELDNWMSVHGTTAERVQQRPAEPTSEEWDTINADLEQLAIDTESARLAGVNALQPEEQQAAREQENKLKSQQELVRAAADILTSVSNNQSEKFQKSTFLELMRRIRDEEVTVVSNSLVDVETGEEIATRSPADEDNADRSVPLLPQNDGATEQRGGRSHALGYLYADADSGLLAPRDDRESYVT